MRIAVVGYGHVGKYAVEKVEEAPDMELSGIFSRRADRLKNEIPYKLLQDIKELEHADVAVLCTETEYLFDLTPRVLEYCNTVDSFDRHDENLEYFRKIDKAAKKYGRLAIYCLGLHPGKLSREKLWLEQVIPEGETLLEYGIELPQGGVSRGHSAELNRVFGDRIELGVSRTLPKNEKGQNVREVTIAKKAGVDEERLIKDIMNHPYFREDEVRFWFEDLASVRKNFTEEHSGHVVRKGRIRNGIQEIAEFKLILSSNPEFTANVLVSYIRAINPMLENRGPGAYNIEQIPDEYILTKSEEEIICSL